MNEFDFVNNNEIKGSEFERSLETISASDIAAKKEKKKISGSVVAFNIFRYTLLFSFIGVFVYCIFNIVAEMAAYSRANELYSNLAERFESDDFAAPDGDSEPLPIGHVPSPLPSYENSMFSDGEEEQDESSGGALARSKIEQLKQMNKDSVAWIMVDGAKISLPVVKGDDNTKYLDIAFDGSENWTGTIFMDCRNSSTVSQNKNTVLYGHNMEGGQMFNNVTKFLDEDFFYNNRFITLYTSEGLETYEVFSVYKTTDDYICANKDFESEFDFVDFCYEMKSNSVFSLDDMEFEKEDRIITMVTCTNGYDRERYCLQGKLIKFEK